MKKLLLSIPVYLFIILGLHAQNIQLDNAGFEEWEDVSVGQDEPFKWSSIKTSDNPTINAVAPVNWAKCDTAHTGNYSAKLTNLVTIIGAVATGGVTNGRFHTTFNPAEGYVYSDFSDEQWNKPFTGRPDCIAVWIKYYPVDNDTLQAKFLLHKDYCTIGILPEYQDNVVGLALINLTGEHDEWTRISAPFEYYSNENPEYFLAMLTAGAGLNSIGGSMALYDDIEIIYGDASVSGNSILPLNVFYSQGTLFFRDMPEDFKGSQVELIDLTGKTVLTKDIEGDRVSVQGLTNGIYIAAVKTDKGHYSAKLYIK